MGEIAIGPKRVRAASGHGNFDWSVVRREASAEGIYRDSQRRPLRETRYGYHSVFANLNPRYKSSFRPE
jgi:hypothetical protein